MLARGGSFVAWSKEIQPRLGGGKYGGGDAVPARQRCWLSCWPLLGLAGGWAWVLLPGLGLFDLNCFYFLAFSCLLFSIITHLLVVGFSGLCPGLRTMCALFGLVRRHNILK